uniref:Threonylcarbamoyl-AMP synthase n=1 Tax=Arcella intermedia TaxID=1963864 RepID=A0A6B2L7P5_9EUKA
MKGADGLEGAVETRVVKVDPGRIDEALMEFPVSCIRRSEVVAFPTETVYGLGANALDTNAVKKIFLTKRRPQDNPLIVHISDLAMLHLLVQEVPPKAQALMSKFWPGPLTLLFAKSALVPDSVVCGQPTVAVRMPSHPIALKLISLSQLPIAAPSANLSGRPSPTTAQHVIADLTGRCPCIIDGGPAQGGVESTVVDITKGLILRPGIITLEQLQEVYPDIQNYSKSSHGDLSDKPPTPGLKYRHYAPVADVVVIEFNNLEKMKESIIELWNQNNDKKFGLIHTHPLLKLPQKLTNHPNFIKIDLVNPNSSDPDLKEVAKGIFGALRDLDFLGVNVIVMEGVTEQQEGLAIMNRIRKAAKHII